MPLSKCIFKFPLQSCCLQLLFSVSVSSQVRYIHAGNMDVPDFSYYRRNAVKDSSAKSNESADDRKGFSYLVAGGLGMSAAYGGKSLVNQFISSWSASQDVLALAKIEIKLGDIPEGELIDNLVQSVHVVMTMIRQEHDLQVERQAPVHQAQDRR